jgi:hypothetical protein
MERTKKNEPEKIRWRKTGGGSLRIRLDGKDRIIKPGQKFSARVEDIPEAFRDTVLPLDEGEYKEVVGKSEKVEGAVKPEYFAQHRGGGWYNIVDANGKKVNEGALKREEAEAMIAKLMG